MSGGMSPKGFSLVSVLVSSALGLMVVMGISHNMIQTALNRQIMEKRHLRQDMQTFIKAALNNSASCQNTLSSQLDSGAAKADKNLAPHAGQERKFEIKILKDANGGTILDFSKDASGNLTHQASKSRLSDLGIDRFEKMEFIHSKSQPSLGKVVLKSKTSIGSLHNRQNRELVWHLSGLTIGDPDGADTDGDGTDLGDQVQSCSEAEPLKILCGSAVTGSPHSNGGGFVENSANVNSSAFVDSKSVVCGNAKIEANARVFGGALVKDRAIVKDRALVYGNAQVSGDAEISGDAKVYDGAKVSGNAKVKGHAKVYDSAKVSGRAEVKGQAKVYGMAEVKDDARVYGTAPNGAKVFGQAIVSGSAQIYGKARVRGSAEVSDSAKIYGSAQVYGNAQVYGSAKVSGNAKVYDGGKVSGSAAHVRGNAQVFDSGAVFGNAQVYGNARIKDLGRAFKNAHVYGNAQVIKHGAGGNAHVRGNAGIEAWVFQNAIVGGDIHTWHNIHGNCRCELTKPAGAQNMHVSAACSSGTCSATPHYPAN